MSAPRTSRGRSRLAAAASLLFAASCATSPPPLPPLAPRAFAPSMVFPADLSLKRAEDGVALEDGRLVVGDQVHGLRLVERDGRSRPFGDLPGAGYAHDPPRRHGAANGVSLEPGGEHVLVADILGGGIYRVELASEATELVYRHPFGVNSAVRDSTGAVWFTQSARNTEDQGEMGMFTPVDIPTAQGALWRLPVRDGRFAAEAEQVAGDLRYANGVVLDEERAVLYLCELAADRVLAFPLDVERGSLGPATTLLEMPTPDNVELDADGRLWIASPVRNEVLVVDPSTRTAVSALHQQSAEQAALSEEWARRGAEGVSRLELITPALYEPLPGMVTGVVLGAPDGAVYVTGLGDALLRLEPARPSPAQLTAFASAYAEAWSSGDPEQLASFYAERGTLVVNDGAPCLGRAAVSAKARAFMEAFPDMEVTLEAVRLEAGRVRFDWRWTGTNTGPGGTGRAVDLRGHELWTLSPAGLIAASRGRYDTAEYERQVNGAGEGR